MGAVSSATAAPPLCPSVHVHASWRGECVVEVALPRCSDLDDITVRDVLGEVAAVVAARGLQRGSACGDLATAGGHVIPDDFGMEAALAFVHPRFLSRAPGGAVVLKLDVVAAPPRRDAL